MACHRQAIQTHRADRTNKRTVSVTCSKPVRAGAHSQAQIEAARSWRGRTTRRRAQEPWSGAAHSVSAPPTPGAPATALSKFEGVSSPTHDLYQRFAGRRSQRRRLLQRCLLQRRLLQRRLLQRRRLQRRANSRRWPSVKVTGGSSTRTSPWKITCRTTGGGPIARRTVKATVASLTSTVAQVVGRNTG